MKTALILDSIDRGTIQTALQTNGYYRQTKLLASSPKNWGSICDLIESEGHADNELIIIGKLTEHTLFRMCLPQYENVVKRFLKLIKNTKHILFIYRDNMLGNFSHFVNVEERVQLPKIDEDQEFNIIYETYYVNNVTNWINDNELECSEDEYLEKVSNLIVHLNNELKVLPYEKLIDIEISGQNFIENIAEGMLFRVYIPNERIWSNEFTKFINLFRDYSSVFSNEELKILQNKTDFGVVCSVYSNKNLSSEKVNVLYKDFTHFMELCIEDPCEAEQILNRMENLDEGKKKNILTRYIKESQRLILDIQQEREIKILNIKHRLQNEINEIEINDVVEKYIQDSLPSGKEFSNVYLPSQIIQTQNIYINSQVIDKIDAIVSKEINGNIAFTNEEIQLEKLIEKYSINFNEITELKNGLYELKDPSSSKETKRASWQKLYGFLGKVADKIGDVGVSLLTKYLEQQIGM